MTKELELRVANRVRSLIQQEEGQVYLAVAHVHGLRRHSVLPIRVEKDDRAILDEAIKGIPVRIKIDLTEYQASMSYRQGDEIWFYVRILPSGRYMYCLNEEETFGPRAERTITCSGRSPGEMLRKALIARKTNPVRVKLNSGIATSTIRRIEAGEDCQISTFVGIMDGMGYTIKFIAEDHLE